MSSEEIEITIAKDGSVQVQVRGVQGTACLDLTRDLETALGGIILSREMTPEAEQQPPLSSVPHPDRFHRIRTKRAS